MAIRAADTDAWADEMQMKLLREAGPTRRLQITCELTAMTWNAARAAFDRMYPEETEEQRDFRFLSSIYGKELAEKVIPARREWLKRQGKS